MIPVQSLKKIEDRVAGMQKRPRVGVLIDLDGVLADQDDLQDETIANTVWELACSIGRLCSAAVYYSTEITNADGIDNDAWARRSFKTVNTGNEGFTGDDLNLDLMFDVHAAVMRGQFDIVVLVVGSTDYSKLAQRLIHDGVAVVMVSNYPKEKRVLPKHSCIYVPMYTIIKSQREEEPQVDTEEFDYSSLIRLLATSEDMLPFVAVGYFIKRVMFRLGEDFQDHRVCQKVFQSAKNRDIIEVYERENKNSSGNMVSACRLNEEHPLVTEVLHNLEKVTSGNSDVQVSVDTGDSGNDHLEAPPSLQPTT